MQAAARFYDVPNQTIEGAEQMFWTGDVVDITSYTITENWDHKPVTTQEILVERGYVAPYDPHWVYSIQLDDDPKWLGRGDVSETNLKLVRRGNLWNYHHGQPLVFKDTAEEGQFFFNLGHVTLVRSKRSDNWYLPDLMKAMQKGKLDTFTRIGYHNQAYTYDDPEVGSRIRELTLKEFEDWRERIPRDKW
jgi:hypothetical protein